MPAGGRGIRQLATFPWHFTTRALKAPPEAGADRILTMWTDEDENEDQFVLLGGEPMHVIRTIPAARTYTLQAIADVDADGPLDIVALPECYSYQTTNLVLIDYTTGQVKWTGPDMDCGSIGVGQLDADEQLELVLPGTPGVVLDGKTKATQWTWPDGFGPVLVGQFDNNASTREFVSLGYSKVTVFSTSPAYAKKLEFPVSSLILTKDALADFNHDGVDELLDGSGGGVKFYDPRTGSVLKNVTNSGDRTTTFAVGPIYGDGREQVIFGQGEYSSGADELRSVDLASGAVTLSMKDEAGPYSEVAVGPFGGSGKPEAAFLNYQTASGAGATLRILDWGTGQPKRALTNVMHYNGGEGGLHALSSLSAPGNADLAIAGGGSFEAYSARRDGPSLGVAWETGPWNQPLFNNAGRLAASSVADVNGDGVLDLLVATSGGKLIVQNGVDGQKIWDSVSVNTTGTPFVAAANVDGDGQVEYLLARGKAVYVFDSVSLLLQKSFEVPNTLTGIAVWGTGGAARIGVLDGTTTMGVYDLANGVLDRDQAVPADTRFVAALDSAGTSFVAAAGGRVYLVQADGTSEAMSGDLGAGLGDGDRGAVRFAADGSVDVVVGSENRVARVRINLEGIFEDGFD